MAIDNINRREFLGGAALLAGAKPPSRKSILNFNADMEYRKLGRTGLMVSAVSLGGHWKRVDTLLGARFKGTGYDKQDYENMKDPLLIRNRDQVLSYCMEKGINYLDVMAPPEVMLYGRLLKGRRDKMYLGYGWYMREPRFQEWRSAKKLMEGFDQSLKESSLDYVDIWRVTLPMEGIPDLGELQRVEDATIEGLIKAKKQGKARFTGVSTHNRVWLQSIIETYPEQIEVACLPYTATSKELPKDSVFRVIKKHEVGTFAIKPFANNSLFAGDSSPASPHAAEDDRRARLALRNILANPAITAPIPGLISPHQVDNAVQAIGERRQLDLKEKAELEQAGREMWSRLDRRHQWLKDWEYV